LPYPLSSNWIHWSSSKRPLFLFLGMIRIDWGPINSKWLSISWSCWTVSSFLRLRESSYIFYSYTLSSEALLFSLKILTVKHYFSGSSTKGFKAKVVPDYLTLIKGVQFAFSGREKGGFDSLWMPLIHTLKVRSDKFNLNVSLVDSLELKSKLKYWLLFLSLTPMVSANVVWGTNISHHTDPVVYVSESSTSWKRSELETSKFPHGLILRWVVDGVEKCK